MKKACLHDPFDSAQGHSEAFESMKNSPRFLLWTIIFLTIVAVIINLPSVGFLSFTRELTFKKGLDLAGGTSLTYKADMKDVDNVQKDKALEGVREVIERRVNFFGVSEPVIQTAVSGEDYRIIVELPGVDVEQAKEIIGTTAQLSFWESQASGSALATASPSAYPLGVLEILGPDAQKTELTGKDLQDTSIGFDANNGKPQVQLNFTNEGSKKFAEITKRNVGKVVAIVLDNQVIEAPVVNQAILNGEAVISGGFTDETAKSLSTSLNAGALPVSLIPLQEHTVDATLGIESLFKSLFAGFLGIIAIIIFMVVSYGRLGVVASLALILYTLFVLSIFKISSITPYAITLTLSGIAGFILSVGMAVDANILIFERMKEEISRGRSWREAVDLGFSRAWTSIRDSNISSLITSFVLYQFGTGVVRGFALVLAIGVIISMFSEMRLMETLLL